MTETFPPDLRQFVQHEIANGVYGSEQELLVDAVRLLREQHSRLAGLREEIQARLDALERGAGIELEDDEDLRRFLHEIESEAEAERSAEQSKGE